VLKEKREQLAKLATQIKAAADTFHAAGKRWADDAARANWDKLNSDYNTLRSEIETLVREDREASEVAARSAEIDAYLRQPAAAPAGLRLAQPGSEDRTDRRPSGPTAEQRALALQGWCLSQRGMIDDLRQEHVDAARACRVNMADAQFTVALPGLGRTVRGSVLNHAEMRAAMGVSVDTAGGYTVPEGFVANLEIALKAYGGVRNVAEIVRTSTAQPLPWPTMDDTSNSGEVLGENVSTSTTGTSPTMGSVIFGAHKFSSKLVQISSELLRDSAFNLASEIGRLIGIRLGRAIATKCTTGAGNGAQPTGIVTRATLGVTTASATAITFDEVIKLIYSVDPAYRQGPGAGFLLHDNVVGALRLLKDGMGRYLWSAGSVTSGLQDRIWNFPYQVAMEMASTVTSAAKTMLFGDLSKYKIREVGNIRLRRLVERFAEYDQEGFIGFMEVDGDLLDAGTHPVKYMLQAT
jgi:HK97 family phage major capsid protein